MLDEKEKEKIQGFMNKVIIGRQGGYLTVISDRCRYYLESFTYGRVCVFRYGRPGSNTDRILNIYKIDITSTQVIIDTIEGDSL